MLDVVDTGRDTRRHPLGEHLRLSGAGASLDQDIGQEVIANPAARFGVYRS